MRNYLIVALRNLNRERLYAAINITGLALGIACCVLLGLFLYSELTYDRHNLKHERIYRVVNEMTTGGRTDRFAVTSRMLGPLLAEEVPGIEAAVRLRRFGPPDSPTALRRGDETYYWDGVYFADHGIFEVFTHDILYGDPATALREVNSIAVSRSFARRYFGDENPIGQTIMPDNGVPAKVTLVFADLPANSHLRYDVLFSGAGDRDPDDATMRRNMLWNIGVYTYLLVAPDFDPDEWPRIDQEFYERNMSALGKQLGGSWHSWLQPLAQIHLDGGLGYDRPTASRIYLYGCAAVALFILVVACINYTNLATARATRRARSVGIRKILGASRMTLALQYLAEAVFFALLALVLAIVLVEVVLRFTPINALMGQDITLDMLHQPGLLAGLLGLGVLIGLLAGAYPAIYLSSWAPLSALTGKYDAGKGNARFRELLVLLQFTISAAVIACTLLMAAQMRFVSTKSLGFERENRLLVTLRGASTVEKLPTIRTELARNSNVLGVATMSSRIGDTVGVLLVQVENNEGVMTPQTIYVTQVGTDYPKVMGMQMVAGRDFSQRLLTDIGLSAIVNETLVRNMGWTEPLGKRIAAGGGAAQGRVIGVVKDFNYRSLHTLVEPFVMLSLQEDFSTVPEARRPFVTMQLLVNISGADVRGTLRHIEDVMREVDPKHPFEYVFLDDHLDSLYRFEQRLMRLTGIFAAICIFISCLGLFGLAAFTTEQRTREIGTRKVLGATTWQIILLLCKRILLLVLVASMLASLIAWLAIDEWLTGFAYRAPINPLIFVSAAVVAAIVAFATVAMQSYRTASADPVDALRHD